MLIQNLKVFDDYVSPGDVFLTSDQWNAALGRCSALAVTAVIDDVGAGGPGQFDLCLIHSADGRDWWVRSSNVPGLGPAVGNGDISIASVASAGRYVRMYSDGCRGISLVGSTVAGPLLPFVRMSMKISTVRAHVKLYATCRGPQRW